jgi:putative PIN family toxin of toxin-antitoxin system
LVKAVVSREVLAEYCRVGEEFARARPMLDFARFLSLFTARALMVNPPALERPVCRDPHDDMFIACAIGGRADLIVSGDKDSLSASEPVGVRGVTPRGFLDRYLAQEG